MVWFVIISLFAIARAQSCSSSASCLHNHGDELVAPHGVLGGQIQGVAAHLWWWLLRLVVVQGKVGGGRWDGYMHV